MAAWTRLALLTSFIAILPPSVARAGDADAQRKALAERAASGKDVDKLRQDVFVFRRKHPGTAASVKAAELLRDLPSPLDELDAKAIPEVEKFPWHPKETVAVLGEHRGRQGGAATAVAWSKNGKWLASTSTNGYVRVWDAAAMRLLHTLGHSLGAYSVAFSKDNTLLAHGGGDGQVRLWEIAGDKVKEKGTYKVTSGALTGLVLGPNNKWFVAAGGDSRLYLWDLSGEKPREAGGGSGHSGAVHCLAQSPDGKTVASAGADKTVRLWALGANNQIKSTSSVEAHTAAALSVAWNPADVRTMASGGADGAIRVWTAGDGKLKPRFTLKGKGGAVHGLAYSPSGKTLAAACADGTIRTYNVAAGTLTEKGVLEGHVMAATGVAFAPDGQGIASAGSDWTVRQWPAVSGPRPRDKTIKGGHLSHVYTLAFSPDEQGLASGSYDKTARYWELGAAQAKERAPAMKADAALYSVAFAPDGKTLAASGNSVKFRTFDVTTGRVAFVFEGHTGIVNRLSFAPDGNTIASCSTDKSLYLWDPKTGKGTGAIKEFEAHVNAVTFSPGGEHLLCCSGHYLYDKNGQIVVKDGNTLYLDSTVRVYDAAKLKETYRWKNDKVLPGSVTYAPDGKQFFAGGSDTTLRRWDAASPPTEPDVFYKGGSVGISTLACSPDGRWLASWGPDYRINLYELATGKKVREWTTGEQFGSLAFAQDSRHLAVSLGTGVVLIWRLEEAKK